MSDERREWMELVASLRGERDDLAAHEKMQLDKITELDAEVTRLRTALDECRRLLRFVLDNAQTAGDMAAPHMWMDGRKWREFEQAARAAGGTDGD